MGRTQREFTDEETQKILRLRAKGWSLEQLRLKFKCARRAIDRVVASVPVQVDTECSEGCGEDASDQVYRLMPNVWALVTNERTKNRRMCVRCLDAKLRERRGHGLQLVDFFPCVDTSVYLDVWKPRLRRLPDWSKIEE